MTYRDDHDAALARADALEVDVERLERERAELVAERDRLAAERDQLAAEPPAIGAAVAGGATRRGRRRRAADPVPVPDADPDEPTAAELRSRKRRAFVIVFGGLLVGAVFAYGILADVGRGRAHDRWRARLAAREHHQQRWDALISVEPCVRMVAFDAVLLERYAPERYDPRTDQRGGASFDRLAGNCTYEAKQLVEDQATRPEVESGLARWLAVEARLADVAKALDAYYGNRDWVEDDLRGGRELWATAHGLLDQRRAIIADLRTTALPALRAEMRGLQAAHETAHGRDLIWWRVELGLALWAINERSYDVTGVYAGREPDDAAAPPVLREPVTALLAASRAAPLEVRRDLRKLDWITGPLADGRLPDGEAPLWNLAHSESDLLRATRATPPAPPPAPGREPDTSD